MQTPHNRLSIKINNKTKTELIWAEIFRRYVNDRFACDYQEVVGKTFQIPKDYPDIDVVLVSPSGRENLFLQLRRDLGKFEIIDIDGKNTPLSDAGEIGLAISSKQEKYGRQKKNISNIILLIQGGGIPYSEMGLWSKGIHIPKNTFRGIYYISPKSLKNESFVFLLLDGLKNVT